MQPRSLSRPGGDHETTGGKLPRPEPLLCGLGDRRIQAHKRPFGIAELSRAVPPGHHLRLVHHVDRRGVPTPIDALNY
jgi:hypothetical protein